MSFLEFLVTLENTMSGIEVKGKENVEKMFACFGAIENMKNSLMSMANTQPKEEMQQEEAPTVTGGDEDG